MSQGPALVVTGGGTGGHIYPGLAVVEALWSVAPGLPIQWVGVRGRLEERVVPRPGLETTFLPVATPAGGASSLWSAAQSLAGAAGMIPRLRSWRAGAVLGLGSYVALPTSLAAVAQGVPLFLMEQNARPGKVNRWLAERAAGVFASFEPTAGTWGRARLHVVGNPVRASLLEQGRGELLPGDGAPWRLLVVGGSQGARVLNEEVPRWCGALAREGVGVRVQHASGPSARDETAARYRDEGVEAEVLPYIDDMGEAYRRSHFVICRAGATTIAELSLMGLPALYVPFRAAADDHQRANAEAMVRAGGGVMVLEDEVRSDRPMRLLRSLLAHPEVVLRMGASAQGVGRTDAADVIAARLLATLQGLREVV